MRQRGFGDIRVVREPVPVDPSLTFRDAPITYKCSGLLLVVAFIAMLGSFLTDDEFAIRAGVAAVGVAMAFHGRVTATNWKGAYDFEIRWLPKHRWLTPGYVERSSAHPTAQRGAAALMIVVGLGLAAASFVVEV